jgi:hypothetical protein
LITTTSRDNVKWCRTLLTCPTAAFAAILTVLIAVETAESAQCRSVEVKASQNLALVMASKPPCTTFILKNLPSGKAYHLHGKTAEVQSGDEIRGNYRDGSRVQINADKAEMAFDVNRAQNGATFRGVSIYNTSSNEQCENKCGKAIGGQKGRHIRLINVRLHHNPNLGASLGDDSVVKNSLIDHNGSYHHSIMDMDHPSTDRSSASGLKFVSNGIRVENTVFWENYWQGVWCDNYATNITLLRNQFLHNGKIGAQVESCRYGRVAYNRFVGNGFLRADVPTQRAGLHMLQSANFKVHHNYFRSNWGAGFYIKMGGRQRAEGLEVHYNRLLGNDRIDSCSLEGVTCYNNPGNLISPENESTTVDH